MEEDTIKKGSLLEIAMNTGTKKSYKSHAITAEHIEVALAWASGEITLGQVAAALGKKPQQCYLPLALILREYVRRGN